ncbi:hypothetical protein [Roseospira marina]|nr:hypothetical protein [Roseospira marina]MBB4312512.1 hypothetical protein [Roseospira marina]MBB5085472.1 hypothetical protein [Roseospira marina]
MGQATQAGVAGFVGGDIVRLGIETPDYPAWIQLDYFDGAG